MNDLIVIDNFHPRPFTIRFHGITQTYEDWLGPDGEVYKRICRTEVPEVLNTIEYLMGPVEMLGMGYRLNYNEEEPNAAIHSDLGWGSHALVLYLSEGPGGTAFWKHRRTGRNRIENGDFELFDEIKGDWNILEEWEQERLVEMKFNRALIYESALFHSRWPFKAFGNDPETGRLIVVAFFTPKEKS
jgi:hypothetical protein